MDRIRRFMDKEVALAWIVALIVWSPLIVVQSCTGPQTVKPYELGKVTAETLLYDARAMQNKGTITAAQFDQVRKVYDQLRVAQDIAIDARKAVIVANAAPDVAAKAQTAMNNVIQLSTQLIGLAQSIGIKLPGGN